MISDKNNIDKNWQTILKKIQSYIENENLFELHIQHLKVADFYDNILYVITDSNFVLDILSSSYIDKFNEIATKVLNTNVQVKFVNSENFDEIKKELIIKKEVKNKENNDNYSITLKKSMLFSNFVVGDSNKDAYEAVKMIATNNFTKWTPLFLYGNTGLGKTHLANALGNEYLNNFSSSKVIYVSSDDFTRDVMTAITNNTVEELKNKYKEADLLIVEDVQFFTKRDKTNEIFFNIFNSLIHHNKIIFMTSDKSPLQLYDFDERMKSRFASGLIVKIEKPDKETMYKILKLKFEEMASNIKLTDNAINKIIGMFDTDIRKLEGIINRILFFALTKYNNLSILDSEQIDEILKTEYEVINQELHKDPNIILEKICRNYNIKKENVLSDSRKAEYTNVRKICMYVFKNYLHKSFSDIGRFFNRNHSTVISSIENVEKMLVNDSSLKKFIELIIAK